MKGEALCVLDSIRRSVRPPPGSGGLQEKKEAAGLSNKDVPTSPLPLLNPPH